jgi:hypothetical protein
MRFVVSYRCTALVAAVASMVALAPAMANAAGSFDLRACGAAGGTSGWTSTNTSPSSLEAGAECPPVRGHHSPDGTALNETGIYVSDRLGVDGGDPHGAPAGAKVEQRFTPAADTTISRLRYWRFVVKADDFNWYPYTAAEGSPRRLLDRCEFQNGSTVCNTGAGDWNATDSSPETLFSYSDTQTITPDLNATGLTLGITCRATGLVVCGNGGSLNTVQAELFDAIITITDPSAPTVQTPAGLGWTITGWASGTLPLTVASGDNTGIKSTQVLIDGSVVSTVARTCSYTRPVPCSDEPGAAVGIPTAGVPDGMHTVQVRVRDAADNPSTLTRPAQLRVDNQAPAAPVGLNANGPTARFTNRFDVSWSLPADAGSPITAARYQLCDANGANCGAVQDAPARTWIAGLALPRAGTSVLRVWLVDELGHADPATPAGLTLTYQPPSSTPPATPSTPLPMPTIPATTPTVQAPPAKIDPRLRVARVSRTGRRIRVTGTTSTKASGRVTIRYRARIGRRTRTITRAATLRRRGFAVTLTLSRTLARARTGTVTVRYAGDADTRAAAKSSTVRLKRS